MNIDEPLENAYFHWLYGKLVINEAHSISNNYLTLFRILQNTEFVWLISGDDNRAEDGLELRREFILQVDAPDDEEWRRNPGCSVLEMLFAFSKRTEFITGTAFRAWFWEFLENLELDRFNDSEIMYDQTKLLEIEDILDQFLWRTYDYNGNGGLFPLDNPEKDQRKVEVWYQFPQYLVDKNRLP